jgi:hypothetical protein
VDDLHKALGDISSIRLQVARSTEFRGYGPVTLAATGLFAMAAAGVQAMWIPAPAQHISRYLALWIATAAVSATLTGAHMYTRSRRIHSWMSDAMIEMAVEQFMPAVGAGLLVTLVLLRAAPGSAWMIPGLWQVIFSLGVFSSCRFLPRPILVAGAWYLLTGLCCLGLGGTRALSPWAMGIPFGAGQFLVAAILFFSTKESGDEA